MKLITKIDKLAVAYNKIFTGINVPLVLCVLLISMSALHEFYTVGILKQIDGYPWGCKCFQNMGIYRTPGIYSKFNLMFGSIMSLFVLINLYFTFRKRALYAILITIFLLFILALINLF